MNAGHRNFILAGRLCVRVLCLFLCFIIQNNNKKKGARSDANGTHENGNEEWKREKNKPETTCKRTRCVADVLVKQVLRQSNHWT